MKKIRNIVILLLFLGIFIPLVAQAMLFKKKDQLKEAASIRTLIYYESVYRENGYQPLKKGQDTISFPYPVGVKMKVVGGIFWVGQKPFTKFVKENNKVIKRVDCSNEISGFCYLPLPKEETVKDSSFEKIKEELADIKNQLIDKKNTYQPDYQYYDTNERRWYRYVGSGWCFYTNYSWFPYGNSNRCWNNYNYFNKKIVFSGVNFHHDHHPNHPNRPPDQPRGKSPGVETGRSGPGVTTGRSGPGVETRSSKVSSSSRNTFISRRRSSGSNKKVFTNRSTSADRRRRG